MKKSLLVVVLSFVLVLCLCSLGNAAASPNAESADTRTVTGFVWPMAVDIWNLGPSFLALHDVVVELREDFNTPATVLKTIAVPNSTGSSLGEFTIENVPYGDYILFINRPGYLLRTMDVNVSALDPAIIELEPPDDDVFNLWWGDCNGDFVVNTDDTTMILNLWNVMYGDPSYNAACDLDADGRIDNTDLMMAIERLGYTSRQYPGVSDTFPPIPDMIIMDLEIDSEWLYYYDVIIDHDSRTGFAHIILEATANVIFIPVLKYADGTLIPDSDITDVKYYLDGIEYQLPYSGEPGEFDYWDLSLSSSAVVTIKVWLADGTVISYDFTYEIFVIQPNKE